MPGNPFADAQRVAAIEDLRPKYAEEFYRAIGRPQDLPDREELSWGKRLVNAFVAKETGGFEPYSQPEVPGRIDPQALTADEQKVFYDQPKIKQVIEASRYPGGIALLAQNNTLAKHLFDDEPTVFQQLVDILPKVDQPEHRAALTNQLFDLGVKNGMITQETADYARRMYDANQLSQGDVSNLLKVGLTKNTSQEEADQKNAGIAAYLKNIELGRQKTEADIAQSYGSAAASRSAAESSAATAARTVQGKLYRFPDGKTMYDSDSEFKTRLDRGETPLLVSTSSGTEAGVQSVISKQGRSAQALMYQNAIDSKVRLEKIMEAFNDPNATITGLAGIAREFGPAAANIPGLSDLVTGVTGKTPEQLQKLKTDLSLLQFQLVDPIVREPRKTDEERKAAGVITQPGQFDTQAVIAGRNKSIYHMLNLNADKNLFAATGKFLYDITNPDPKVANAEAARFKKDLFERAQMTKSEAKEAYDAFARNQEFMRSLGQQAVNETYTNTVTVKGP